MFIASLREDRNRFSTCTERMVVTGEQVGTKWILPEIHFWDIGLGVCLTTLSPISSYAEHPAPKLTIFATTSRDKIETTSG